MPTSIFSVLHFDKISILSLNAEKLALKFFDHPFIERWVLCLLHLKLCLLIYDSFG